LLRSPLILAGSWFITCCAIIVAGLAVRLAPIETTVAWPFPGVWQNATALTGPLALVLAAMSAVSLFVATGSIRGESRARPFGELLLFFPLVFAFVWFLLPTSQPNARSIIIGSMLLVAGWYLFKHSPGLSVAKSWQWKKSAMVLDIFLILMPIIVCFALGFSPDLKAGGLSFFLYPVYALAQLMLFLFIPVSRLRAIGVAPKYSTLFSALIFAMIHWPNPVVMFITLVGMLIWAHQFQNGRKLWQLALVMGLTATTFSQFLPDQFTYHMRVGPGYVRSEAVSLLAENSDLNNATEFFDFAYPQTIGREIMPEELEAWTNLFNKARRTTWAYMFMTSSEKRKKLANSDEELPPAEVKHWADWPEKWKNELRLLASDEHWAKSGKTLDGYLSALYQEVLGRQASPQDLKPWQAPMSDKQRQRIAEVLLDLRLENGQAVFSGMEVEGFRLPN